MNLIKRLVTDVLEGRGYKLHRFNREQVVPSIIPDPATYTGPEDYSRLHRPWLGQDYDRIFTPEVLQNTMLSRQKLYLLHKLFKQTMTLPGDVLEAGVGSGGSARLMLNSLRSANIMKSMWLLDTFEGYKKVDAVRDGSHVQVDQCKCNSKEEVQALLKSDSVRAHLIKGLIPGTLAEVKASALAFAHVDVNLYEPTLAATDLCLQRMVSGGIILFDDYCWPATYGARQAIDEACEKHGQEVIAVPESTQAFTIKR